MLVGEESEELSRNFENLLRDANGHNDFCVIMWILLGQDHILIYA